MTAGTIEWTGKRRWNPQYGCSIKTAACNNCYAMRMAHRLEAMSHAHEANNGGDPGPLVGYRGTTKLVKGKPVWTGNLTVDEAKLTAPLRWKKPALCFTDTQSDFFHESLPDEVLDRRFAVMALSPHVHFQVLTKRWDRMREYCNSRFGGWGETMLCDQIEALDGFEKDGGGEWGEPLPNVSVGVSVHDQASADAAIPALLATPAALRFVSYEPALGPVDWRQWIGWVHHHPDNKPSPALDALTKAAMAELKARHPDTPRLDLIIAGDESGPGHRPADPDWYRQTRDQCAAAGVPFFLKQMHVDGKLAKDCPPLDGKRHDALPQIWKDLI